MPEFIQAILKSGVTPIILLIIGGIIGLAGAGISAWQQNNYQDELYNLSKKNTALSEENKRLTEQALSISTGGHSYCRVYASPHHSLDVINLCIENRGEYPLYDVKVYFIDQDKQTKPFYATVDESFSNSQLFDVGTIPSKSIRQLSDLNVEGYDRKSLGFRVFTRNGHFGTSIHLKKIKG